MLREIKPRNARTARIVKAREPQLIEDRKKTLLLHGSKCPLPLHGVLRTFHKLTKPHSVLLNKKNENIHPFENAESLEFLAKKNECGLVVWGSSSKKRPNTVTLMRMFDSKALEMVELLLMPSPGDMGEQQMQIGISMKPMLLFAGTVWDDESATDQSRTYAMLKSLFLDIFSGEETKTVDVAGLQYILMIAAGDAQNNTNPIIHLRWYKIRTEKSGQKIPRVEVDPVGAEMDFALGRARLADAGMMKEAMKKGKRPNEEIKSKQKNIGMDAIGDKIGRVHLGRQDLSGLQTRKMKGLKRGAAQIESDEEIEEDLDPDVVEEDVHKKARLV
ncbi:MAG: hypothetical protein Q9227_005352 [Pyrenula ochraceoflavens]